MNTAIVKVSKAAISARQRRGGARLRSSPRGWGQGVRLADGRMSWPTGRPSSGDRFDDPIDDQLRHAIAWDVNSSHDLALAAGISPVLIDKFMQGHDVLTLGQAARLAPLVGLRLADQAIIEGYLRVWDEAGKDVIECPPNSLRTAAVRRARRG